MPANVSTVIKKHRVKVAEPRPIGGPTPDGGAAGAPAARTGQAEVRIAHTGADRAVLEVRCGCGRVIHVECRWETPEACGEPDSPAAGAPQPNKEAAQ